MSKALVSTPGRVRTASKYATAIRIASSLPLYRLHPDKGRYTRWLSRELEQAGCLFVKIGQWVSSRADVFPQDVVAAFEPLRNSVSPMPAAEVSDILERAAVPGLVVEHAPVSCGSVAQVHVGRYQGRRVAVKIRRPDLTTSLHEDLALVQLVLSPLRVFNRKSYDDATKSLDELGATVMREADLRAEAAAMDEFAHHFEGSDVRVPRPHYSCPELLVMDYLPSQAVTDPACCQRLMDLFLTQLFGAGLVHTDLHAGNLGVTEGGALVLYDFGSVQRCPANLRRCFKHLLVSYLNRDARVMVDYMLEHGVLRCAEPLTPPQRQVLEQFVETVLEYVERSDVRAFGTSLTSIALPDTLPGIEFCPELFMVLRSFTLLEGTCKSIDPNFVILDAVVPFATTLLTDPELYAMKVEDDLRSAAKAFGFT